MHTRVHLYKTLVVLSYRDNREHRVGRSTGADSLPEKC